MVFGLFGATADAFPFVFVQIGCAMVQGPAAAAFSLSLEGSVGNVSAFFALANGAFLAVLEPDLGGVRSFRRHCGRVPFCVCSGEVALRFKVQLLRPFPCIQRVP